MKRAKKRNSQFSQDAGIFSLAPGGGLESLVSAVERDVCASERLDARDLKLQARKMTLEQVLLQVSTGNILVPGRSTPWDSRGNTQYIESIYLGLPAAPFWFVSDKDKFYVADGARRIQSLVTFVSGGVMKLTGTEYRHFPAGSMKEHELEGRKFAELSSYLRKKLLEETVSVFVIPAEMDRNLAVNVARRMMGSAGRILLG